MAALIPKSIAQLGGMSIQGIKTYIQSIKMFPKFGNNSF